MTTGALAETQSIARPRDLQVLVPALLAAIACLAALFHQEIAAAVTVWLGSTAYNHCFFVLPIAAWLAWDRRPAARGLAARPTPWPALAILPLGLCWFAAERTGVMEGRQFAFVLMVQALLVALLGWRLARVFAGPIAYLVFLVPFGGFLTHPLQLFTARFVDVGLTIIGIPHVVTNLLIEIPEGSFFIAEACAGLRFLIAAIAFGALYVLLLYRSPGRRIAFLVACAVVPVFANGLRALGIVMLGHALGSAQAAEADHIIYGWGFFSVVILLLTAAGLPFREDAGPRAPALPPSAWQEGPRRAAAAGIAACIVLLAALGPAASAALVRTPGVSLPALPAFAAPAGCRQIDRTPAATFECGLLRVSPRYIVLSSRAGGSALKAALYAATGEQRLEDATAGTIRVEGTPPRVWRLVQSPAPPRLIATLLLADGRSEIGGAVRERLAFAWNGIAAPPAPIVLAAVNAEPATTPSAGPDAVGWTPDEAAQAERILEGFLAAQADGLAALARATGPHR